MPPTSLDFVLEREGACGGTHREVDERHGEQHGALDGEADDHHHDVAGDVGVVALQQLRLHVA